MDKKRRLVQLGKQATAILSGEENLAEWSEEELLRGQRKSSRDRFEGTPPLIIPRAIHQELVRRRIYQVSATVREAGPAAAEYLAAVVKGEQEPDPARVKAADSLLDRLIGRAPQHVQVDVTEVEAPWQKALRLSIVGTDHQLPAGQDDEIVVAELVDDKDPDSILEPEDPFDEEEVFADEDVQVVEPKEFVNMLPQVERMSAGPYDSRWEKYHRNQARRERENR